MTKKITLWIALLLSLGGLVLAEGLLKVNVKETNVRKAKKFYAQAVDTVRFGDSLKELLQEEVWFKVETLRGYEGWVHESAVAAKKWSLPKGSGVAGGSATVDEVALAGKGFNKEVEDRYRTQHSHLSFNLVDRVERIKVSETRMEKFLEKGGLGQ